MKVINPSEMLTHLKRIGVKRARLLGLDVGTDCIGSAISVHRLQGAEPLRSLLRDKQNCVPELKQLVSEYKISGFIIGYPTYKLQPTRTAKKVEGYVNFLIETGKFRGLKVCYWDEYATSKNVDLMLDQLKSLAPEDRKDIEDKGFTPEDREDIGGKGKGFTPEDRKDVADKLAAVGILQGYLDYFNTPNAKPWKGFM